MNAADAQIVYCPSCSKKHKAPTDRGTLRITCSSCAHVFEWAPSGAEKIFAPQAASPASPSERSPAEGLLIVFVCALVALGSTALGARLIEEPPLWLALGGAGLGVLLYYFVYRGFRLLSGAGKWSSLALTIFGFPAILGGLLFLIGEVVSRTGLSDLQDKTADLIPGGDSGAQDSAGGDYFQGLHANNTDAAKLDEIIEDW